MKNSQEKKIKTSVKKAFAPRPSDKRKKEKAGDAVEELFGVHIISDEDIENHFGTSEKESDGESKNKK